MADIVDMKQRVAATEAKLKAANAEGEKRSRRLLQLLDAVEQNFSLNQREIRALRQERAAAAEEILELRNLLQEMLTLAETSKASRPSLPHGELENLIERLSQMAAAANSNPDAAAGEADQRSPGEAEGDEQAEPPGDKDHSKQRTKSRGKNLSKILTLLTALGWHAATGLIAERSHGDLIAAVVEAGLARSHSAAHALS